MPRLIMTWPNPFSVQVKWRNIHFIMWDIGGQESLRQAWSTYYSGTQFVILVVDSTDKERLAVSREELYKMLGNDVSSSLQKLRATSQIVAVVPYFFDHLRG